MNADRDAALAAFDDEHAAFIAVLEDTPEAALRFRPAGEDYALGGLAVHVAQVLEKYARVLHALHAADFAAVEEPPSPSAGEADAALVRDGFDQATRAAVLERVRQAHVSVVAELQAVQPEAFQKATPVTYAGTSEPFATSHADILGWVRDHYAEHILQITDLYSSWATTAK